MTAVNADRIWEAATEQEEGEQARERRRNFVGLLEEGGAEKGDVKRHVAQVCAALSRARYYETLAVLLRVLGMDDVRIVECIKDVLVGHGEPMDGAYHALKSTGVDLDAEAMLAALEDVDDRRRRESEFSDIPF